MPALEEIVADLEAEHAALDAVVARLDDDAWLTPTPAEGWDVRDQIGHLAFFDEQAALAVADPSAFTEGLAEIVKDVDAFVNGPVEKARSLPPEDVLEWWRRARAAMVAVFRDADPSRRVPWYGPPMSPASFVTARLMETWAHGQDVVDALGIGRTPTNRLRHVAHLSVRARPNSYAARGLSAPEGGVRVELNGPDGDVWTWGDPGPDRISGSALGFCLVCAQRRHLDDTDLVVEGPLAEEWMGIAQVFAGPPGPGRRPGQFPKLGV